MNSVKAYKALSVVANVEQGALIKRLIKENKKLKEDMKIAREYKDNYIDNLHNVLEEEEIYQCCECYVWLNLAVGDGICWEEWSNGDVGWYCHSCCQSKQEEGE